MSPSSWIFLQSSRCGGSELGMGRIESLDCTQHRIEKEYDNIHFQVFSQKVPEPQVQPLPNTSQYLSNQDSDMMV